MKLILRLTLLSLCCCLLPIENLFAQPESFNYQAVIRDGNGDILSNEFISLRFTIYSSPDGGEPLTAQYIETHDAMTNEFGLVNVAIGSGQPSLGLLSNLQWSIDEYHLKTELDNGNGWIDLGTQQLLSVPFAQRADTANDVDFEVWRAQGNPSISSTNDFIGSTNNAGVAFRTNNIERMYIGPSGDVGIGTHTPGNPDQPAPSFASGEVLHVESPDGAAAMLLLSGVGNLVNGDPNVLQVSHASGHTYIANFNEDGEIQFRTGANTTPSLTINQDGIEVGSSDGQNPNLTVTTADDNASRLRLQHNTTGSGDGNGGELLMNGNNLYLTNQEAGNIYFTTNDLTAMTLGPDGQFGIGTTSPDSELHIEGGTDASLSTNGFLLIGPESSSNMVIDVNEIMARNNGETSALYINGNGGNVAIGTTSTPSFQLVVSGTAAKPGGGDWAATSDARLKQNVVPFSSGLQEIMKISPVTYQYIEKTGYPTDTKYVGTIAQDLQSVCPSMVSETEMEMTDGSKGNYLSVDPSAFTYMLINGMKEQQQEIELLKEEIQQLKLLIQQNSSSKN